MLPTPTRSDTILVTATAYNDAGEAWKMIDPLAIEMRKEFDDAGRMTSQIDNWVASPSGDDENRTTEYAYNADGNTATITARMDTANDDEITTYIYGVTTSGGGGSDLNSNLLLYAIEYPEDTSSSRVQMKYNRLGQVTERKDQNDTVRSFDFDKLGRPVQDRVTTFGTGVVNTIKRIATEYEARGMVSKVTSYDNATVGSGTVQNQVEFAYNDFGQLITSWQDHDGAVVKTGGTPTPKVEYGYADGSSSSNQIRPVSMTYPDGRVVGYSYGTADAINDKLNRVETITLDDGGGASDVVTYKYLGLGTIVRADYIEPEVMLDLWGGSPGSYTGIDRFGRVVDQLWIDYGEDPDVNVARILHGYDRDSNRLYREDYEATANGQAYDELYSYDGLNRLTDMQRGESNGGHTAMTTKTFEQEWGLDQVGNWAEFDQDDNGNGTWNLEQTRSHNKVNEITGISETTGTSWPDPAYDDNGNTTTFPQPASLGDSYTAAYDAWNRLAEVREDNTLIAAYFYDGLHRRIVYKDLSGGFPGVSYDYFHTANWQVIETHKDGDLYRQRVGWVERFCERNPPRRVPPFAPVGKGCDGP